MTTSKLPPPRKLTESEDVDSFDDWWFHIECYYSRDENFHEFFNTPEFTWQPKSVRYRGLQSEQKACNLNNLLRAIAMYTVGPYIKTNITDKATSLAGVKEEFLKFLQIEVNDLTSMAWFEIQRKQTERPLVFYHRLRYHMTKHLVKENAIIDGTALPSDENLSPSMERLIVMEWLHRMDNRLIKFVQEKFSTELSAGSSVLITMIETLSRNIDSYITIINASEALGAVSPYNPSFNDSPYKEKTTGAYEGAYRSSPLEVPNGKTCFRERKFQPKRRGSCHGNQSSSSSCEYCYIQSKTRDIDFDHPIARCPEMAALHGSVDIFDDDTGICEEEHEFETFAQEFVEQNNCEHHELPPMNIMNITGVVSNGGSTETIPVKKLPSKPMQPPSRPTLCDKSQLSQELVDQSQQTTPGNLFDHSIHTLAGSISDLSVEIKSNDEEPVAVSSKVAAAVSLQAEVDQLKKEVAALVFMKNRASTAVSGLSFSLPSSHPALPSRTIPPLMSLTFDERTQARVDNIKKRRDKAFISRMFKILTKLETKYLPPKHIKRRQLSTTKQMNSAVISKELTYNYHALAAPEPEKLNVPEPIPRVTLNDARLKPAIPNPKSCPVLSCSPHHDLYVDRDSLSLQCDNDTNQFQSLTENLESASESKISGDESSSTFSSIPLDHIDFVPTARNSSTDVLFIDAASHQVHAPSKPPQLLDMSYKVAPFIPAAPLLSTRRPSVICCPAGTCDGQFIAINLSPVDDVFLEPYDDVIDQVSLGNNSPDVSCENYPVFFIFLETVPSTEVVPVDHLE